MSSDDIQFDHGRTARIGLPEAVFSEGKTTGQLTDLINEAVSGGLSRLFTRLYPPAHAALDERVRLALDYDVASATAFVHPPVISGPAPVIVVTAGTTDLGVACEAARTLAFHGVASKLVADVGVAGIWRLLDRAEELAAYPIVIAVAGMEGALFSVLGGLVPGLVIAVPTSNGYGVAAQGHLALGAALSSCAPGIVACNIDNGYGAACAALRALRNQSR